MSSNRPGFTLIETILYVAIASVVLVSLSQFGWNIIGVSTKNNIHQDIVSDSRFALDQISLAIRNATDIDTANSDFDTNIASTPGSKLTLRGTAPNDPVVFDVSSGSLRMQIGTNTPVLLTSNGTFIETLIFTDNSAPDGRSKNIHYELSVTANPSSSRQEYQATTHLRGDTELRSNNL